jgi:Tfp pilus assembly protein PilF
MSAAVSTATYLSQERIGAMMPLDVTPLWLRAGNAIRTYAIYLRKVVWPSGLSVHYPHLGTDSFWWETVVAGFILCLITGFAIAQLRKRGWIAVGWFWFLGTLVPVIGLVQVGGQAVSDRCMYIPLIGLSIVAAWGMSEIARTRRIPTAVCAAAAATIMILLVAVSWIQTGYWKDSVTLFSRAIDVTERNWNAYFGLGSTLLDEGDPKSALACFEEAISIKPDYAEAHTNAGIALLHLGKPDDAVLHFIDAIRYWPDNFLAWKGLAEAYIKQGKTAWVEACFAQALRINPASPELLTDYGNFLASTGRMEEAASRFQEALWRSPSFGKAKEGLDALGPRNGGAMR